MLGFTNISVGIVLSNDNSSVYITKRKKDVDWANYLEFPGGKAYLNESTLNCLKRELYEEININPIIVTPYFSKIVSKKGIILNFFLVNSFEGIIRNKENQTGDWISIKDLKKLKFPKPNHFIISQLKSDFT